MKRVLTSLLLVLTGFFMFSMFGTEIVRADEGLIDLYPNEDINNLKGTFGNSGWVLDFGGYRYHTVSFMARFASNFVGIEDEEKTVFVGSEIGHLSANAMGGFIHNNTERDLILKDGDRTNLTGVINRVWAVFNEEGKLVLYENHVGTFYLKEVAGENYFRLATEEEIAVYEEAEEGEKPADMRHTHIRIALNEDGETYKAEPLGYLKWTHADFVPAGDNPQVGEPSYILDYDPNEVHLKAGWTALHYSTWDRGKPLFNQMIAAMPEFLVSQEHTMELNYLNPAPYFVNLTEKDENPGESGLNFVYDYESIPKISKLIEDVEARHVNQEQSIAKTFTNVDYAIKVYDEENVLLETIDVEYDVDTKEYVPTKEEFEEIDTSDWGARYLVKFESVQPESATNETSYVTTDTVIVEATIDVGVLPIYFTGVVPRYIDEGLPIDLFEGITAYDNSRDLNDISDSLTYEIVNTKTQSNHFNIWNAKAGIYELTIKAKYDYVQAIDITNDVDIKLGELTGTIKKERINIENDPFGWASTPPPMAMYTIFNETTRTTLKTSDLKYNVQMLLVNGSGEVVAYFNTVSGKMRVQGGAEVAITGSNREPSRSAWIDAINFGVGYKLIAGYAPDDAVHKLLQAAKLGDKIEGLGFAAEVIGIETYRLTVNDITDPVVMVKAETMTIYTDNSFKNAEEAILSNLVIIEESDYNVAITGLARIDVTEEGEYDIKLTVSDEGGNEVDVEFTLVVLAPRASQEDLDDLQDELDALQDIVDALQAQIAALEDALEDVEGDVEALETALAALEATLETANGKVTALQTALDAANDKITNLENKLAEAEEAIDGLVNPEEAPKTGCRSAITGGISILVLSFMLGTALVVFLKKRK